MNNKTTKRLGIDDDAQPMAETTQAAASKAQGFTVIEPGGTMYTSGPDGQRIILNLGTKAVEINGEVIEPATSDQLKAVYDLGYQYSHHIQAPPGYQPPWELPTVQASGCESC